MGRARFSTPFSTTLTKLLAEAHMTQADLARALQVSPARINQILCARKWVSAKAVDKIANVLNVTEEQRAQLHLEAARLGEDH